VRRAACIVTVSEGVREELMGRLGVAADRITVIHEAAPPGFEPVENPSRLGAIRERYHLPSRFVLFVGLLEPKKNLPRLLDALGRLHAGGEKIPLVLAGARGWAVDDLDARVASSGLASSVRFLGPVSDEDLAALYSAADCFCFPSLYEGFGLPVLEAMACGTPVVASTRGALPELTAGAALLVDPLDVGALAEAIRRLWNDGTLRLELRERGLTRAKAFSWQRAAQETLAVYHRAAPR
jgi:glycosyltransferase involved in cell wall biosynthesis